MVAVGTGRKVAAGVGLKVGTNVGAGVATVAGVEVWTRVDDSVGSGIAVFTLVGSTCVALHAANDSTRETMITVKAIAV